MSDTSNLNYKRLAIDHFMEVFKLVDDVMRRNEAPFYLIGVNASDIQLLKENIKPSRGTKDIDFAVMVSSFTAYQKIKDDLVTEGFTALKDIYTLYHPKFDVAIDLLPFGEIEQNDTISFSERAVDLVVLGFKETLQEAHAIVLEDDLIIHVPPLHGMVILKLISWSDRPEHRATDLDDIYRILSHYYTINLDVVLDEYSDLLAMDPFDQLRIAARIIGRRISTILTKSRKLEDRIMRVLEENSTDPVKSSIARYWASKHNIELEYAIALLGEIKSGIEEIKHGKE